MTRLEDIVREAAFSQGFALVGFAPIRRLDERTEFFRQWLTEGRPAEMAWLAREPERRFDPRTLDPKLRAVISLAFPYDAPVPPEIHWQAELRGRIAAYALGPDYHNVVLAKAGIVAEALTTSRGGGLARVYVDTGPVFEREWAAEARLGWFGRNTNLLNRYHGSYFFLAEIFTDAELAQGSEPYRDHCGSCRQCLDMCPTHALAEGYLLEPRLCISYLTIEHRGPIPWELRPKLGNWIFGCDICQEVCPWNRDATVAAPVNEELMPSLVELLRLDEDGFRRRYGCTAIRRTKRRGLLRNAAVVLGNSGNPLAVPPLARSLETEADPLIRMHAAWALGRLGGVEARRSLECTHRREDDSDVKRELVQALSGQASEATANSLSPHRQME